MSSANGSGKVAVEANNGTAAARSMARLPTAPVRTLERRTGRVAKEARERARYEIARVLGDAKEERAAARAVAELLASHDVEIDVAVELALKTLAKNDDPELRHALAGWLEGLGEPDLAASELRKLVSEEDPKSAAALLVRVGVLHARAGDAQGADEALSRAASLDEDDPLPLELLGAIGGWAPEVMSPRAAAEAYVRAAKRRAARGDADLEIEDLLRAIELDPSSPIAAAALATAHAARDHETAADEVLRAHASALAAKGATADAADVHARRRASALERGALSGALAAALDEGLDAVFEGPGAEAMDDLLLRSNAFDPVAVRLVVRAERATGKAAAARWVEAARLLAGALAANERALEAYGRAVAADATNADAMQALRALATSTGSRTWLLEGLVRALLGDDAASRRAAGRVLVEVAEGDDEAPLAAWASAVVRELDPNDDAAGAAAARLGDVTRRREE
jgi:Tfp pilus assembly protein PilF